MNRRQLGALCGCTALAWFALLGGHAAAPDRSLIERSGPDARLKQIGEDPDPIGPLRSRSLDSDDADGAFPFRRDLDREESRHDVAWDALTGSPVVVWSHSAGNHHDVAFSRWDGRAWRPADRVSSTAANELDPRIAVGHDGTLHVVWWEAPSGSVYVASRRSDTSGWSERRLVSTGGRRPSITVFDGRLRVALERDAIRAAAAAQEVVVLVDGPDGRFLPEMTVDTSRTGRLDPLLHVDGERLWLDWKHASEVIAFRIHDGHGWRDTESVPWPAGLDASEVRARIRSLALAR